MPGTIERAMELARTGQFNQLEELKRRLEREGHEGVHQHFSGRHTRDQIVRMISNAKRSK